MGISISSLLFAKQWAGIQGLSHIVLSAFAPGAQQNTRSTPTDGLDTSSADNCQKSLLSVIEAQIIPQLMQSHTRVAEQQLSPKQSRQFTVEELTHLSDSYLCNHRYQPLA